MRLLIIYSPTYDPTSSTAHPTTDPTINPTAEPTIDPTKDPTMDPTIDPSNDPTLDPTIDPTQDPTAEPTIGPSADPTSDPTNDPTSNPTSDPTVDPTSDPTVDPTVDPTIDPTMAPTNDPSVDPTANPTMNPSSDPTSTPSNNPSSTPTDFPSPAPSTPTLSPTIDPDRYVITCDGMSGCAAHQTRTCPSGSACIFNVTSGITGAEIQDMTINAQNAKSLQVYCNGVTSACGSMEFYCPNGGTCELYAISGEVNFASAKVYAQDSAYLYIETHTLGALRYPTIWCPRSSIKGGANGKCDVNVYFSNSGGPYAPLSEPDFRTQEAWKDLSLTCTISNGNDCGQIKMRCGENYQYVCDGGSLRAYHEGYGNNAWKVYQPDGWRCENRWSRTVVNHPCNDFTYTPTAQLSVVNSASNSVIICSLHGRFKYKVFIHTNNI